ncbi:MAG: hypothetical protein ACTJG2_03040 [Candidatus Saccharimonadales bacterium]
MKEVLYREVDGEILPPEDVELEESPQNEVDYEELYADRIYAPDVNMTNFAAETGPSVDLDVRREALLAASAMYANAARARGLNKHADTPAGQKDLQKRYNDRAGLVVAGSNKNHTYSYDDERRTLAPAIGVDAEAWIDQRLPADEEAIALGSLIGIRRAIGKSAGHKNRAKVKKRLERPAA